MSNNRYIEIDSTYRDRTQWPLPSNFEVLISQSGRKNTDIAVDPVCLSMPVATWTGQRIDNNTPSFQLSGTIDSVAAPNYIAGLNGVTTLVIRTGANELQQAENYYQGLILEDTTQTISSRITGYRYIGNDRAIVSLESPLSGFADGDTVVISDPTDITDTSNPLFFVPSGRSGTNAYTGYILYNETVNQFRTVTGYDTTTHILTVDASNPITGWSVTDNYSLRDNSPTFTGLSIGAGSTTNSIIITGGSTVNGEYNNMFIRLRGAVYGNSIVAPEGETSRITSYNGTTQTATISPSLSTAPTPGSDIEILRINHDNMVPFVYTGSQVSQQQMVCYEIQLLNLILPNKTLATGRGSRIAFYPYVYVELSNVSSAGAGLVNTIYSNNPNSTRMIFRAAVDDVNNPTVSSFINLKGNGMVQTLKFKPNDNLRFSVHLPNGDLYQVLDPENFSPLQPNEEIQISALFAIKRL